MNKSRFLFAFVSVLVSVTTLSHATLLGINPAPLGSHSNPTIGFAYFDSLAKDPLLSGFQFVNQAPSVVGSADAASGGSIFSAAASANMTGGSNSSGDRLYNGVGPSSAAFNLMINGTASADLRTINLQMKYTLGDGVMLENYASFFTVMLDGIAATGFTSLAPTSDNGLPITAGQPTGIAQWTWADVDITSGSNFVISISSAATGHVSLDTLALDIAAVPEPHEYAFGVCGLLAAVLIFRRRWPASVA